MWHEVFASSVLLPSSYHAALLREPCLRELASLEREVRTAQARDALNDVRTAIIGREAYKIKKIHVSGKHHKTRATNHIRGMEDNVRAAANRYRRIRAALLALGMAESDPTLRPLCKGDTAKYTLDAQHKTLGESRESKPWIWERFSFSDTQGDGRYQSFFEDGQLTSALDMSSCSPTYSTTRSLVPVQCAQKTVARRAQVAGGRNATITAIFYVL